MPTCSATCTVTAGGAIWSPARLPLIARFAASNVTTVDAAVSNPSDLTQASWTKSTNASIPSATRLQTTTQAGSVQYYVTQAIPNLQINHPVTISFDIKADQLSYLLVYDSAFANAVNVNATNGTRDSRVGTAWDVSSAVASSAFGGGGYRVTISGTTIGGATLYLYLAKAGGASSFSSPGAEGLYLTNIDVQQRNISAAPSLGGTAGAVSLTQGTAANRPGLLWTNGTLYSPVDPGGAYKPVFYEDGVNDRISGTFAGAGSEVSVGWCGSMAAYAAQSSIFDSTTGNKMRIYRTAAGQLYANMTSGGLLINSGADETNRHAWMFVFVSNGVVKAYRDGVLVGTSGTLGALDAAGLMLGAYGSGTTDWSQMYTDEIWVANGSLTLSDSGNWYRYCKRTYPGLT